MNRFSFQMSAQPDDTTCGPTCLHCVYRYYGDEVGLDQVISETGQLTSGGTLAAFLGCHALRRGYRTRIYTYNLQLFDPTWFRISSAAIVKKLTQQKEVKSYPQLHVASDAYIEYLNLGGEVRMEVLNTELILHYLAQGIPILTGLCSTFLYLESRERVLRVHVDGRTTTPDDILGSPSGHFVVLCGYDEVRNTILVADPFVPNPFAEGHHYAADVDRVFAAIMLGIVTYDANLLIVFPSGSLDETMNANTDRE